MFDNYYVGVHTNDGMKNERRQMMMMIARERLGNPAAIRTMSFYV